jgi:hypothetical protein
MARRFTFGDERNDVLQRPNLNLPLLRDQAQWWTRKRDALKV